MERKFSFTNDEIYHIYSRGVNKQNIFSEDRDRWRFQVLLLLSNQQDRVHLANLISKHDGDFSSMFAREVPAEKDRLVSILAYAMMPNHFHLVVRQRTDEGVSKLMQKLTTAYSMYFNTKYERSGSLLTRPFRAKHVNEDPYYMWIFQYVHSNPVELFDPQWKEGRVKSEAKALKFLAEYPWASYYDYYTGDRPQGSILSKDEVPEHILEEFSLQFDE